MNGMDRLDDVIGGVDPSFVEAAKKYKPAGRRAVIWIAAAACVALAAVFATKLALKRNELPPEEHAAAPSPSASAERPSTEPSGEPTAAPTAQKEAFVIPPYSPENSDVTDGGVVRYILYGGRYYFPYIVLPQDTPLLGEKIGAIASPCGIGSTGHEGADGNFGSPGADEAAEGQGEGGADEPSEGLFVGSSAGAVFSAVGYDPEFMLIQRNDNGAAEVYVNGEGRRIDSAADLLENCFRLSEDTGQLGYSVWNNEIDPVCLLHYFALSGTEYDDKAAAFISALLDSEIVEGAAIPEHSAVRKVIVKLPGGAELLLDLFDDCTVSLRKGDLNFLGFRLKLAPEAAEPIMELIDGLKGCDMGRIWDEEHLSLDCVRTDSVFGSAVPGVVPEGYEIQHCMIHYDVDRENGTIIRERALEIVYYNMGRFFALEIMPASESGQIMEYYGIKKLIPVEELTLEDLEGGRSKTDFYTGECGAVKGDTAIIVLMYESAPEDVFAAVASIAN